MHIHNIHVCIVHVELCPNVSAIHNYLLFSADLVVGAYESQLVVLLRYERESIVCINNITSVCRSLPVITVFVDMRVDASTPVELDSTYAHVHDNN